LFSPGTKVGDKKYIDIVNEALPELAKSYLGVPNNFSKFQKLKYIIHTGFKN